MTFPASVWLEGVTGLVWPLRCESQKQSLGLLLHIPGGILPSLSRPSVATLSWWQPQPGSLSHSRDAAPPGPPTELCGLEGHTKLCCVKLLSLGVVSLLFAVALTGLKILPLSAHQNHPRAAKSPAAWLPLQTFLISLV